MRKNNIILVAIILFFNLLRSPINAQVLGVPVIIQEQTEWCWAASSKCVLDFYGHVYPQCEIVEYTRNACSWHDFGSSNCCSNPNLGCNYWNYNYGSSGSMEDILNHFGGITTINMSSYLSLMQVQSEIGAGRPFIFRWGWYSGGGHFLTGYGVSGSDLYYNNSLVGYGHEISNYYWVVDDGNSHSWTHTQTLIPGTGIEEENNLLNNVSIFPNPTNGLVTIKNNDITEGIKKIILTNTMGQEIKEIDTKASSNSSEMSIDISDLAKGIYSLSLGMDKTNKVYRIVKE